MIATTYTHITLEQKEYDILEQAYDVLADLATLVDNSTGTDFTLTDINKARFTICYILSKAAPNNNET